MRCSPSFAYTCLVPLIQTNMLRGLVNNASRFAGGAAVAAAATPDPAQARALQPRSVLPAKRDEDTHKITKGSEYLNVLDADWILAHIQNGDVFCDEEDVRSVMSDFLCQSSGATVIGIPPSEAGAEDDDRSSCTSIGESADEHIEQVEKQNLEYMTPVLTTLLNNEGVQKSIFAALKEDDNFARFLHSAPAPLTLALPPPTVEIEEVDEAAVQSESSKSQSKPFQGAMDKVGAGLIKLGEDLKGAGEHLGGVFVGLGNKLRGTIIGAHAHTKKAVQDPKDHKEFWMNALGVVAMAVLTMLFAKGKLRVRTA